MVFTKRQLQFILDLNSVYFITTRLLAKSAEHMLLVINKHKYIMLWHIFIMRKKIQRNQYMDKDILF